MALDFTVKFVVNRISGNHELILTDTSDFTGLVSVNGFWRVEYPDGIFVENKDQDNPDFTIASREKTFTLREKNGLILGDYKITQKVYSNEGYSQSEKTITFSFEEPTLLLADNSNTALPQVSFKNTTVSQVDNYTVAPVETISSNFPTGTVNNPLSTTDEILLMSNSGDYYEGIYTVNLSIDNLYTGTLHTVQYLKTKDFTFDIRRSPQVNELVNLLNTLKTRLDNSGGGERKMLEQAYQQLVLLYSHILAKTRVSEGGIQPLIDEMLKIAYSACRYCFSPSEYEYLLTPIEPFDDSVFDNILRDVFEVSDSNVFTLRFAPLAIFQVFRNGKLMVLQDLEYSVSGTSLTIIEDLVVGDEIVVYYTITESVFIAYVQDLVQDIETFIQSFEGGTTGQVYTKLSNNPLDSGWADPAAGTVGPQGPQGEVGPTPIIVQPDTPVTDLDFLWIDTDEQDSFRVLNRLLVESLGDLEPFLSGDEYILPTGLVILNGTIDLGTRALRVSTGTILRGLANATIISTNTNGVVRATNIGSAVILREFNVVCPTGTCFVLTGTIDHQLNMFFVGMFGAKAAIITGFDVQGIKGCYIQCADGITLKGTTNKPFIAESPFYGITGSAITLASDLVANVADIVTTFFKYNAGGIGITAEVGYTVLEGKIRGSLIDGTAIPLVGLSPSDENWTMTDNTGIADSRIVGGFYLDTAVETVITTINTPVKVAGTTIGLALNERLVATTNRLTYTGLQPTIATLTGSFAVDSGNNVNLSFYIAKNGVILPESRSMVRVGSGTDERSGVITSLVDLLPNDYVEIWVENNSGTDNLTCLSLNLNGIA